MRAIFIVHPCNRDKVLKKMDEMRSVYPHYQLLIFENEYIDLNLIYMKLFAKNEAKVFMIKNGKIDKVEEMPVC